MASNLLNSYLVSRFDYDRMLLAGTITAAFSAIMVALFARSGWGGLWSLVVPLFVFASATGFIVANSTKGTLDNFPDRAGAVSALVSAVQYGSGMVVSGLVGNFANGTPWPMGWVIAICGIGSLLSMRLLIPVPGLSGIRSLPPLICNDAPGDES